MRASILIAVTALAMLAALPATPLAAAEMTLEELIELVRQNELLYERIDFTIRGTYRTFERQWKTKLPPLAPNEVGEMCEVLAEDWQLRVVYQTPYFRLDRASKQVYSKTESKDIPFICAFDGEKTRLLSDTIGNISAGFATHNPFPQAHTLVFGDMFEPLSVLLSGDKAISSFGKRGGKLLGTLEASYRGVEDWGGLRCHRVHLFQSYEGRTRTRIELWLALDRNLIPARRVVYVFNNTLRSFELKGVDEIHEWQEIHPAIWFPARILHETYFTAFTDESRNGRLNWRLEVTLDAVKLNPEYPVSFFRFDFPAGTAVYEVDKGEIIRSYRAGTPQEANGGAKARNRGRLRWLLALLGACIAASVLLVVTRRRHKARNMLPPGAKE